MQRLIAQQEIRNLKMSIWQQQKQLTTTGRVKRSSAAIIKVESCFYFFNGTLAARSRVSQSV
jgi:hypothetical protein